ncbi:MAG: imidazole glycerol phosphate synthase subunit HisH [Actinomycetota bacterium]|jgi:imidazole glycerol-phosphate synthase subunit HisH
MSATVVVLDYGSGNLHSVSRALAHVGAEVRVAERPEDLGDDAVLIPGVGHFGHCVRALRAAGFEAPIRAAVDDGRPVIGVCVGMQILFEASEEDDEPGLGILPGAVRRLPETVRVPHMGWNTVAWAGRRHPFVADIADQSSFYFVHSYAPDLGADVIGATEHGRTFAAVVARDNVFATQFHPEKSGEAGLQLYANIVRELAA